MFEEKKAPSIDYKLGGKKEPKHQTAVDDQEITLTLLEEGVPMDENFVTEHAKAKNDVAVNGSLRVDTAKAKANMRQRQDAIKEAEGTIETPEDLIKLDETINRKGIRVPSQWVYDQSKGSLLYQQIEAAANGDAETQQEYGALIKDMEKELRVKQAIEKGRQASEQMMAEASYTELGLDLVSSILAPYSDFANLRIFADDIMPGENYSGIALSTGVINQIDEWFRKQDTETQIEFVNHVVEKSREFQSQYGIGKNVLVNTWINDTILNTLEETRAENGGVLGVKVPSDVGLLAFEALEVTGAKDMGLFLKNVYKKMFGRPKPVETMKTVTDRFSEKVKEAGATSETPEPMNPATNMRGGQGSIFDAMQHSNKTALARAMDDILGKGTDEGLKVLGVDTQSFLARTQRAADETLDPSSVPPSMHSDRLANFMQVMTNNSNLRLIGYSDATQERFKSFQKEWASMVQGTLHLSRSYHKHQSSKKPMATDARLEINDEIERLNEIGDKASIAKAKELLKKLKEDNAAIKAQNTPAPSYHQHGEVGARAPEAGDLESLGTAFLRYGADATGGFKDAKDAKMLADNFKALGHSPKLVNTDDGIFVEIERKHVLNLKADVTEWDDLGKPLTNAFSYFSRHWNPWSHSVDIEEGIHPQALTSWMNDTSAEKMASLIKVKKDYTDLKSSVMPDSMRMSAQVDAAVEYSEDIGRTLNRRELREAFPEIGEAGENAYYAHAAYYEGMRLINSMALRRELDAKGYKQMHISGITEDSFYGKVMPTRPQWKEELPKNDKGQLSFAEDAESAGIIYGKQAFDKYHNVPVDLSDEFLDELYQSGGRIIQTRKMMEEGDDAYSYYVVRNMRNIDISELPIRPDFGIDGYAGHRAYRDVQYKVVWNNAPARVNGEDILRSVNMGVVKTKAHAKSLAKYLREKHPGYEIDYTPSRELEDALGTSSGNGGFATYMRKRGAEKPYGKLDKNGNPTIAEMADPEEVLSAEAYAVQFDSKMLASQANEQRFIKQFAQFFNEDYKGRFPSMLKTNDLDGIWDNAALKKMFDTDQIAKMKRDAKTLHYNINGMRAEANQYGQSAARANIARVADSLGAKDNVVSAAASRHLLRISRKHPSQVIRGIASAMYIAWGVFFQVPQNVLSAVGMTALLGGKGAYAILDAGLLARALLNRGKGEAYGASIDTLARSLGVEADVASDFVERSLSSGILGNAGEVDNLLRYVSEISSGNNAATTTLRKYTTKIASTATRGVAGVVSKSIDATMLLHWSAAFAKQKEVWEQAGKKIGSADFWDSVHHWSRRLSQNQNSSDLLSFERKTNVIASMGFQFSQAVVKLLNDVTRVGLKSAAPKHFNAVHADDRYQAIRAATIYAAMWGSAGFGRDTMNLVHGALPERFANPTTEIEKIAFAFAMGGLVDASIQATYAILTGGDTGENQLAVSARTSPGAFIDTLVNWGVQIKTLGYTGSLDVDLAETMGGAGWSALSTIGSFYKTFPKIANEDMYSTPDRVYAAASSIASLTKSLSDVDQAYIMWKTGMLISKSSHKYQADADHYMALGKIFGFDSHSVVMKQNDIKWDMMDNARAESIAKSLVKDSLFLAKTTILADKHSEISQEEQAKRLAEWSAAVEEKFQFLYSIMPEHKADRFRDSVYNEWYMMMAENRPLVDIIKKAGYSERSKAAEKVNDFLRRPGDVSQEEKERYRKFFSPLKQFGIELEE